MRFDNDVEGADDSSTDIELKLIGGIEKSLENDPENGHRFFLEGKLGAWPIRRTLR